MQLTSSQFGRCRFDSWVGQIGHSVVNSSQPQRCFFEAVFVVHALNHGDGPRLLNYSLRHNTASRPIMKINLLFFNKTYDFCFFHYRGEHVKKLYNKTEPHQGQMFHQ